MTKIQALEARANYAAAAGNLLGAFARTEAAAALLMAFNAKRR